MTEKDNGSSFAIGFLLGAIAGVAIGFLYAPKPGKETRTLLKEKAGEGLELAKEAASGATRKVRETLSHKED
ncbi:MAG: YtxH domain-containing protein [Dehalococcoidales bacterium]|nr:YtxH domain-containing protein [Dehalococcoidales bacterium]